MFNILIFVSSQVSTITTRSGVFSFIRYQEILDLVLILLIIHSILRILQQQKVLFYWIKGVILKTPFLILSRSLGKYLNIFVLVYISIFSSFWVTLVIILIYSFIFIFLILILSLSALMILFPPCTKNSLFCS